MLTKSRRFSSHVPGLIFLWILVTGGFASVADAQQDWQASAYKGWTVTSVRIEGIGADMASDLRGGLALNAATGLLKAKRPTFYPQTLNQDIERVRLFLARRGYPHATITPSFETKPKRETLIVVFEIDPGPPVVITAVAIDGMPQALERRARELLTVSSSTVFVDKTVDRATLVLDSMLTYSGYARARVDSKLEWQDSTRVILHFDVKPGSIYYFGDVNVSGASDDLIALTKKTASIKRGRRYSPQIVFDGERNLRILGLFRQIRMELVDVASDTIDVGVDVRMRESRSFETSARYWTDDGLSGDARWTHRNLFKRGRGVNLTLFGSILRQVAQVSSWWPAILWPRSKGIVSLGTIVENEDAYKSISTGIQLSLRHEYSIQSFVRGGVSVTNEEIANKSLDPDAAREGAGRLFALNASWDRLATDDPIVATRGTAWRGFVEWAPAGKLSQNHYALAEMTGILYIPFQPRSGFALRLTVGLAEPIGTSTEIIPNKRFYSGGSNTMRGFDRRQLGPLDAAGAPLGGNSKVEASVEYRFPLPWRFRGTLFVDSGQVWSRRPNLGERGMEVAIGPGLWIETPIGPLRSDVAYRLTDYEESQPTWQFHFSIGPAF